MFIVAGFLASVLSFEADLPEQTSTFQVTESIVYSTVEDRKLLLDAYVPDGESEAPAVLVVHGGAWRSGNRKQLKFYCEALASRGLACFAIDYRLAPKHKFPAQIEDCRAAVKWIRQNAQKYKADAKVLGAIGYSAGGHLVSLLGTTGEAPNDANGNVDTRLTAVAAGGAPTDFRWFPDNGKWAEYWMGGDLDKVPENFKAASTVPFVDKDDPPFFFFNGTDDKIVPMVWTRSLFEALKKAGVEASFHEVDGAGHMQAAANPEALTKAYQFLSAKLQKVPNESSPQATAPKSDVGEGDVEIRKDVSYLSPDRTEKLDLYLPPGGIVAGELRPGVLIIHGGGWVSGDKGAKREINIGTTLAENGYVCASINYKLGKPKNKTFAHKLDSAWPQNIHDCKTAVRWLRKQSQQLGIDPERIGVIGGSAGGHLTAMLGVTNSKDGLDPDGLYTQFSADVQAFVPLYPPVDLEFRSKARDEWDSLPAELKQLCKDASPITYADANDPPALILHGTKDTTVDVVQSKRLAAAFSEAGLKHHLEIIEGAPHTFHLQPKQKDLRPLVLSFFDTHLKSRKRQLTMLSSGVDASFRAMAVGSKLAVFVGGTKGTILRSMNAGESWEKLFVADGTEELDFRDVEIASDGSLTLMSAGPGEKSRLFHSSDNGSSWNMVYRNSDPKGFFNGVDMWENGTGLVIGDPIDGKLSLLKTTDFGRSWKPIVGPQMADGEYGFAASGTGIVTGPNGRAWVATGASAARVLMTEDYGKTWTAAETGIRNGPQGAGVFSIAVRDDSAVVVGGNYEQPELANRNCAISNNAGKSWAVVDVLMPHKACVRWLSDLLVIAVGRTGIMQSTDKGANWTTLSDQSFYVFDVDAESGTAFFAGAKGKIGRLKFGAATQK